MLNKIQNNSSKNWSILASCLLGILTWGAFTLDLQAQEVKAIPVKNLSQEIESLEQLSKAAQELDAILESSLDKKIIEGGKVVREYYFNMNKVDKLQVYRLYKDLPESEKTGNRKMLGEMVMVLTKIPEKQTVSSGQLQLWLDDTQYGVWIDGKRIENSVLLSMKPDDFANFNNSKLMKNAINYGDHYFQINLMKHDYFEKTYPILKVD
ncbi:hypothetical protein U3A58_12225 [Algoriphagus sp. C2-6-M1]|uniref:hypothetical protein n=1 Tax=Algoriphagus persicinus TaxID=3108754 RepID=UPI002B3DB63B|nr:hypothetical protein [Algoriphagus sp. C2-6-M1]MEB2781161.1 hypothetical protein [Algoriphagus sp. C2-6-M1]